MAGRKPTPTALRILKGNPGKRPLPKHEPKPESAEPERPGWLSPAAVELWQAQAPRLVELGILTESDGQAFGLFVEAQADIARLQPAVLRDGQTIHQENGVVRRNPDAVALQEARLNVHRFGVEFGLTPSSRTKVKAAPRIDPEVQRWRDL